MDTIVTYTAVLDVREGAVFFLALHVGIVWWS